MSRAGPGAFIYTGSGKKQSDSASASQKACTKQACAIQYCLARNDHKQIKCQHFVDSWKECCERADANANANANANKAMNNVVKSDRIME